MTRELERIIELTRDDVDLPVGASERMWAAVRERVDVAPSASTATRPIAPAVGSRGWVPKLIIGGAAAVSMAVAVVASLDDERVRPVVSAPALADPMSGAAADEPAAVPDEPQAERRRVEPEPFEAADRQPRASEPYTDRSRDRARHSPTRTPTKVVPEGDTLAAETELLRHAQRALADGDPQEALRSLQRHRSNFPSGQLSELRDALRPAALCASGRLEEGRQAAHQFIRRHPSSPWAARVRTACEEPQVVPNDASPRSDAP